MQRLLLLPALGTAGSGLVGCAGPDLGALEERVSVLSDPPGAHVQLSTGATGTTRRPSPWTTAKPTTGPDPSR